MQHEFTLEQRKAAYEYALGNPSLGICINLGRNFYGSFMHNDCTWCDWSDVCEYFPELKIQGLELHVNNYFTPEQRKQILTKAIELCTTNSFNPTASTSTQ